MKSIELFKRIDSSLIALPILGFILLSIISICHIPDKKSYINNTCDEYYEFSNKQMKLYHDVGHNYPARCAQIDANTRFKVYYEEPILNRFYVTCLAILLPVILSPIIAYLVCAFLAWNLNKSELEKNIRDNIEKIFDPEYNPLSR